MLRFSSFTPRVGSNNLPDSKYHPDNLPPSELPRQPTLRQDTTVNEICMDKPNDDESPSRSVQAHADGIHSSSMAGASDLSAAIIPPPTYFVPIATTPSRASDILSARPNVDSLMGSATSCLHYDSTSGTRHYPDPAFRTLSVRPGTEQQVSLLNNSYVYDNTQQPPHPSHRAIAQQPSHLWMDSPYPSRGDIHGQLPPFPQTTSHQSLNHDTSAVPRMPLRKNLSPTTDNSGHFTNFWSTSDYTNTINDSASSNHMADAATPVSPVMDQDLNQLLDMFRGGALFGDITSLTPVLSDITRRTPSGSAPSSLSSDSHSRRPEGTRSASERPERPKRPQLSRRPTALLSEKILDVRAPGRRRSYNLPSVSINQQFPVGLIGRLDKTTTRDRRGLGTDCEDILKGATSGAKGRGGCSLSVGGSAKTQFTTQVIGHTMPLVTIIAHLVHNGCPDVSSQLKSIDEHSRYSGSLSDVYQARWPDGSRVAVKCLRALSNSGVPPGKLLKHTARELYTWSKASHPNVLRLYGLALVRGKLAMIAPWMEYSSLLAYIRSWPRVDRCGLTAQVAMGLSYMHELGLVHGDVKGDNVVVSEDGTAKITDFGSTTMTQEFAIAFTATQTVNYSIRWAAPELFQSEIPRYESDVYAFAKTVLEVLTGDIPHKGMSDFAIMRYVGLEGKLPDRPWVHIPPESKKGDELWRMLVRCWDIDPAQRPSINEICQFMGGLTQKGLQVSRLDAQTRGIT